VAKCIYKGEEYRRVSKDEANKLVKKEGWRFCTKSDWQRSLK